MNFTVLSYSIYLPVTTLLTIWVARTLFSNGRVFLVEIFHKDEALADSVNKLLLVGFYLINIGLYFAGIRLPFLHEGSPIGIIFSLVVVGLAAMNLILDFDMIENGAKMGAPKYMEWFAAFGLLVTIVWLYLEILQLLAKLSKRD